MGHGCRGHNCYVRDNGEWRYLGFEENLIKETKEEIGLDIEMTRDLDEFIRRSRNLADHSIGIIIETFLCEGKHDSEYVGLGLILTTQTRLEFTDHEVIDFKWLSENELIELIKINDHPPLEIAFEKARKFINNNID